MSTFHHVGMIFDVPIPTEKKNKPRQYKAIFVDFELPRLIPTRYSFRRFPSIPSSGVSPLGKEITADGDQRVESLQRGSPKGIVRKILFIL